MDKARIFEGIRVLDFSRILAGPYCTRLLADMGAEVIKVEPPVSGDPSRHFPFLTEEGISGYFMQQNCGKKSISLDFRQPEAKEIARQLAKVCDVVVENFRPGVMSRLGLGYEALSELNPSLIMCSISGFGQYGPYAQKRGGDQVAQAMSGVLWMNGARDGPPQLIGFSPADTGAGIHAFGALASALYYREKTGEGQHIDVSLLDCMFAQLEIPVQQYILSKGTGIIHLTQVSLSGMLLV